MSQSDDHKNYHEDTCKQFFLQSKTTWVYSLYVY